MKKVFIVVLTLILALSYSAIAEQAPSVDMMSSASLESNAYQEGTLTGDALYEAMSAMAGVSCIATVNEDNSPNVATMIPSHFSVDGVDYLVFGHGANQTVANLHRTGLAMMEYYIYDPSLQGDENKFTRNQGARLILKYVAESTEGIDEATKGIYEATYTDSMSSWMTVVEVVEVKPLG